MDSSISVVLRKKSRKDGTYPLALRVTSNRTSTYIYLKQYIKESEWDAETQRVKKSHPNSVWLNNLILARKAEVNDQLLQLTTQKKDVTVNAIRKTIKKVAGEGVLCTS